MSKRASETVVPATMVRQAPAHTWSAERVRMRCVIGELVGEPPRMYEWCPASARSLGRQSRLCRLWEERYPRWPSASTVAGYHGSWRGGLLAAGLPVDRPPLELSLTERVEAAQRMDATGMTSGAIARDAAGVITRRPEEPYTTSVRTVPWEPGRATAPATRAAEFGAGGAQPQPRAYIS